MNSRGLRLLIVICLAAAGIAIPSSASADDFPYQIKNDNDQRCITVTGLVGELPVVGASCGTATAWWLIPKGQDPYGSYYWIENAGAYNSCILMRSWGSAAYKGVQYPCMNFEDQYWYVTETYYTSGIYKIKNKAHGACMVLRSWQTQIEGSACADYADQKWRLL